LLIGEVDLTSSLFIFYIKNLTTNYFQGINSYMLMIKNNLATAIKNEMLKAGLDESYFDLVEAEDVKKAQEKINKLVELKKKQDINNSYKPSDHKPDDSYSNFEKSGNVEGMIKSKITRFFGKE
jgi:hypothetical protein